MKHKKRILIDVYYLYVAQTGIKTYIQSVCEEVSSRKDTDLTYIISPDFNKVSDSNFFKGKTPKWKNLLFQLLYFVRKQVTLPILSYWYRADLVFSPDILSPSWSRGRKVSVLHDTFFWDNPEHYQRHWLRYYTFFLEKGLKNNASIITITDFSKQKIKSLPQFEHLQVDVVYPSSGLTNNVDNSKNSAIIAPNRYFLHVGVMEKRKNLKLLIEAFSQLIHIPDYGDIKLYLVGQRGPRVDLDDYDDLVSLVEKKKLENSIVFPGYVSSSKLKELFQNATAYVFPSSNEGFGLPILEAFSYGLPVIISNQGALKEVAGDAAIVLGENSAEELRAKMSLILENESLRNEMKEKGINRLKKFTTEKFFISLEQTFKAILNE
ncbi:glycosyltransferase family 4 protein [Belliella kenyensis]|uniref:Glycosyltransferase family 4 protein n=1 Tax=Belliella kenyensis TaxID=1472724 RepID=A0ABV8ENV3_9BACT|nr:glycosyltransferase family 1 protein [Belliella kenyensis]MCH7401642.1 glycosyltransferase family 4 protein [Belliella kenyensis]MDN3603080.1 glycosyltransferase family 1 protein [Belliella kenyensis]